MTDKPLDWSGNLRARNTVTGVTVPVKLDPEGNWQPGTRGFRYILPRLPNDEGDPGAWFLFNADGTPSSSRCPWIIEQADEPATEEASEGAGVDIAGLRERPKVHHLGAALQGIADEHADVLTPRQIEALYQAASRVWEGDPDPAAPDPRDALIAEMREALEPFAKFADALNEQMPDEISLGFFCNGGMQFGPGCGTIGDLRRARDAYTLTRAKEQTNG